jgi:hypothetical protein
MASHASTAVVRFNLSEEQRGARLVIPEQA